MKNYTGKVKIYVYSSLFLSLICALLYMAAYFFNFEPEIGYFTDSAPLPVISGVLTVTALTFVFSVFITIPKGVLSTAPLPNSQASRLAAAATSAGFLGYAVFRLFTSRGEPGVSPLLTLLCIILGALSALYFLIVAFRAKIAGSGRVYAGFIPILWAAVAMSEAYTNKYVAMNSPVKVTFIIATLLVMLFMLYELRYLLGRGMPRAFLAFALAGILVLAVFVLPTMALAIAGIYNLRAFTAGAVVFLLFGLYVAARLNEFSKFAARSTEAPVASAEKTQENPPEDV